MSIKRLGKSLLGVAIVLVALVITCLALFQNAQIKKYALTYAENKLFEKTGWQVQVEEIEGLLPLQIRAKNLQIKSPDDQHFAIETIHLVVSPWNLLRGNISLYFAELQNVKLDSYLPALNLSGSIQVNASMIRAHLQFSGFYEGLLAQKSPFELTVNLSGPPSAWMQISDESPISPEKILTGSFISKSAFLSHSFNESFAGNFQITNHRSVYFNKIKGLISDMETPVLSVEGDLSVHEDMTLYSNLLMHAGDLAHFEKLLQLPLKGAATFGAVISGNTTNTNIALNIISPELTINQYRVKALEAKSQIDLSDAILHGNLEAASYIEGLPMQSYFSYSWNKHELLQLSNLGVKLGENSLKGNIKFNLLTYLLEGSLEAALPELSELSQLSDLPINGSGTLKMNFADNRIALVGDGSHLSYGDHLFEEISFRGDIAELSRGQISFSAKNATLATTDFNSINFSTSVDLLDPNQTHEARWPYQLSFETAQQDRLATNGSWYCKNLLDPSSVTLSTSTLTGEIGKQAIALQKPFSFSLTPEAVELSPITLTIGTGTLFADLDYTSEDVALDVQAKNIPVTLFQFFDDKLSHTGQLDIHAKLSGQPSDISGDIDVDFREINFEELALSHLPPFQGAFSATLQNKRLKASGTLTGLIHRPITFDAELPFSLSLSPLEVDLKLNDPIYAKFNIEGEIAPIFQLIIPSTTSITGQATSTINVKGTLSDPIITGMLEVNNGSYESLVSGGIFKNVNAQIIGEGNQLKLVRLTAVDGNEGRVTGTGKMVVDPEANFPFEMTLDITKTNLLYLDYAKAVASGWMTYSGNTKQKKMTGELTVDKVNIRIPEEVPAQFNAIEVTYVNMPENERHPTHYLKKKKPKPIDLDIQLDVPGNFFITNKESTSEWYGKIHFTGTDDEPLPDGLLEVRKGSYDFNGKVFEINKGSITFAGDPANKTMLYITASQQIDDVNVDVILKGPIKKPVVSFRSNPPFPQKEILSLILFNRASSEISPSQNAQLNQSIITLSGGERASGLLGKLRRSFGIDRIDISSKDTAESNEVSLRVGKYLSKKLFLSVHKGINSEASQVSIEAKLSKNVKAQAEINSDAEGRMILKWQKDY